MHADYYRRLLGYIIRFYYVQNILLSPRIVRLAIKQITHKKKGIKEDSISGQTETDLRVSF